MERRRTHDSSKKTYESPVLPFAERVMWEDPTLQPAKLRSSWGYGLRLGRLQTSNAHLIGTRVGIVVARTIRRLPASEREDSNLVVAMRGTPVAGRPADVAADDAPTVTRHAAKRKEAIVVPAISGAPLQVGGEGVSAPPNPVPNLPEPTVARAQQSSAAVGKAASIQVGRELIDSFGPARVVPMEVAQSVEPTTKSHAPVKSMMKVSLQRDSGGEPRRTAGQVGDQKSTKLDVLAATAAATDTC